MHVSAVGLVLSVWKKPSSQEATWESVASVQVRVTPFAIGVHAAKAEKEDGGQVESTGRVHGQEHASGVALPVHVAAALFSSTPK